MVKGTVVGIEIQEQMAISATAMAMYARSRVVSLLFNPNTFLLLTLKD